MQQDQINEDVSQKLRLAEHDAYVKEQVQLRKELEEAGVDSKDVHDPAFDVVKKMMALALDFDKGNITPHQAIAQLGDIQKSALPLKQELAEKRQERHTVAVDWSVMTSPQTSSKAQISWAATYLHSLITLTMCIGFKLDSEEGAKERRDFTIEQLEALKMPYKVTGKGGCVLKISPATRCHKQARKNVCFCADLYERVLRAMKGECDACFETRLQMVDQPTQKRLEALGFLISIDKELVIVTW